LKYECVYFYDFADGREACSKIGAWIKDYNEEHLHPAPTVKHRSPMMGIL